MTKEEQIEVFYQLLSKNYNDIKKKYKQMCFLQGITYSEDTLQDTIVKIVDIIQRKGLKAQTEKEIENYLFNAFRYNLYQEFLQDSKKKKDDNIDPFQLEIEDTPYSDEQAQYADMATKFIFNKVKEEFDAVTVGIWRLRYMVTINGQEMNYKKIKQLTGIEDTRRRIVMVNKWVRENITKQDIQRAIENNQIFT